MQTKKTAKSDSKSSSISEIKVEKKSISKLDSKEWDVKKVVVKRRKVDLKPSRASAVAIASQANRAKKKQALIERVSNSNVMSSNRSESSGTKIPLWVWMFFGCSLMLFCVSFYHAVIRPQIEKENAVMDNVYQVAENTEWKWDWKYQVVNDEGSLWDDSLNQVELEENQWVMVPETATDAIVQFFARLSDRDFDGAFDLMIPALRNYNDIKAHFTSFRMNPFLDWIEWWKLVPQNFKYVNSPTYWKDVYNFDLSYVLKSNQEKYEETWEFTVNTQQGNPQISSIRCITSKCSYHPIFWPENFGLMK